MKIIKRSNSVVTFGNYPHGKFEHPVFRLPDNAKYLTLHFDKNGQIKEIDIAYEGKIGGITMTLNHEWFNSQNPKETVE